MKFKDDFRARFNREREMNLDDVAAGPRDVSLDGLLDGPVRVMQDKGGVARLEIGGEERPGGVL